MELELPAIDTTRVPKGMKGYVDRAIKEVRKEDSLGVMEELNSGYIPIRSHVEPEPAGFTQFGWYGNDIGVEQISLSEKINPEYVTRVAKHELRHARAARLIRYADVPEPIARLIVESYAEYTGMINNKDGEKYLILKTTPYKGPIRFAMDVDRYYVSGRDGKTGYRAFIRDIYKNGSMARTLGTLARSIRYARN